jgi:acetyl esterase/lipase
LFADLTGLPPLLIQVGSEEVLLDDALRLNAAAKAAGINVSLEVWDGMMHVWHLMAAMIPEGKQAIRG